MDSEYKQGFRDGVASVGWRGIESAPRDGSYFDAWGNDQRYPNTYWCEDPPYSGIKGWWAENQWYDGMDGPLVRGSITHWMKILQGPTSA